MAPTQKATKRSARTKAYEEIRRRILLLDLPPGTALSENELATTLGLSRTPIREALVLLVDEDLVQVFPKVGSFVSRVDMETVTEARFLREAIELASLRSIVPPLDEAQVASLRENVARQEQALGDRATFFTLDEEYHRGLMVLAGHEGSWTALARAKTHLDRARMLGLKTDPAYETFIDDHRAVLESVVAGDLEAAEARLRSHVRAILEAIEATRAAWPDLFATSPASVPVRKSITVWA